MNNEEKTNVLDYGYVRLIDYMGNDLSIVRSARVSHNAEWRAGLDEGKDRKLLEYMYTHSHNTPFESVEVQFEIKAPIMVFRQWHRHRTQSYNEVSARYTELPAEWYLPESGTVGKQSTANKQGRELVDMEPKEITRLHDQRRLVQQHCETAYGLYQKLLNDPFTPWPRELARGVLPFFMYSRMFAKANLHNWFHFLTLRCDEHAQWEIRQFANALIPYFREIVPETMKIWERVYNERH